MLPEGPQTTVARVKPRPCVAALLLPLAVCAVIALLALAAPKIARKSTVWMLLPGFYT